MWPIFVLILLVSSLSYYSHSEAAIAEPSPKDPPLVYQPFPQKFPSEINNQIAKVSKEAATVSNESRLELADLANQTSHKRIINLASDIANQSARLSQDVAILSRQSLVNVTNSTLPLSLLAAQIEMLSNQTGRMARDLPSAMAKNGASSDTAGILGGAAGVTGAVIAGISGLYSRKSARSAKDSASYAKETLQNETKFRYQQDLLTWGKDIFDLEVKMAEKEKAKDQDAYFAAAFEYIRKIETLAHLGIEGWMDPKFVHIFDSSIAKANKILQTDLRFKDYRASFENLRQWVRESSGKPKSNGPPF